MLPQDWERIYGHPVYYLKTFIDPERWPRDLLPGSELDRAGSDDRARQGLQWASAEPIAQAGVGLSAV